MHCLEWSSVALAAAVLLAFAAAGFFFRCKASITSQSRCDAPLAAARLRFYQKGFDWLLLVRSFSDFTWHWPESDPREVISARIKLNRLFLEAAPVFSADVLSRYLDFCKECFWLDPATNLPMIRADMRTHRNRRGLDWHSSWEPLFAPKEAPPGDPARVTQAYENLMSQIAADLGNTQPVLLHGL